ncbi:MAG: 4-hydroxy-3-methylbut-2-enyl diphosphate reductase [Planctomycetes bacterium]|nr:4-hydroxy-3-methylbut-2-enyl diphosphate reductase [Planctomycetota bacterium]
MQVILCQPRGFCAGVVRAIQVVEETLLRFGSPVYVLHEIVHNRRVVDELAARGAVCVESLAEVPVGAVVVLSAHGVGSSVEARVRARASVAIDATCPLVAKVHAQVRRYEGDGRQVVLVGHSGHPEVEGTRGRSAAGLLVVGNVAEVRTLELPANGGLAYVTQTTLSVDDTREVLDALRDRFPEIRGPDLDGICYATQNRQNAVKELAGRVDLLLVVGAHNSSNSNRLREVGVRLGVRARLVETADDLEPDWFQPDSRIGLTAGASAPECLVQDVLQRLATFGELTISESAGPIEAIVFPLPSDLARVEARRRTP